MAAGPGGVYREPMTWLKTARDWRPTLLALAGLAAGAVTGAVLGGLVLGWLAAIWSLIDWPVGGWDRPCSMWRSCWPGRCCCSGASQGSAPCSGAVPRRARGRFRGPAAGRRRQRAAAARCGPGAPATWRQLGYHLLAMTGGTAGGALVAACWSAPLLAVAYLAGLWGDGRRWPRPRPGGAVGGRAAGRAVGGQGRGQGRRGRRPGPARPQPGEELAVRVESLARPGRDRRRHRRRAAPDRARPARRRPAPAGLPGHAPGHGPGQPHRRARAGPPGHRAGPRRGHRGPGRAAPARPRPAPGRARRPRPGRGPVGDRRGALPVRLRVDVATRCSPASRPWPTSSSPRP